MHYFLRKINKYFKFINLCNEIIISSMLFRCVLRGLPFIILIRLDRKKRQILRTLTQSDTQKSH